MGNEPTDLAPKGKTKSGESLLATAQREMKEEIGISLHIDTGFKEELTYMIDWEDPKTHRKVKINKTSVYFLAFLQPRERKQIVLSNEHTRYYFMPIDDAIRQANFEDQKQLLKNAKVYITEKYIA